MGDEKNMKAGDTLNRSNEVYFRPLESTTLRTIRVTIPAVVAQK